jgi:hypothetical protein
MEPVDAAERRAPRSDVRAYAPDLLHNRRAREPLLSFVKQRLRLRQHARAVRPAADSRAELYQFTSDEVLPRTNDTHAD